MSLHKTMINHGNLFFRWRGFIPLLLIGPLILAFRESAAIELSVGEVPEDLWALFCFFVAMAGLAIRAFTIGFVPGRTSGRNTKEQRADVLNTTGMYSVVRNPLYLGNFVIILGVVMSTEVWWLCLIVTLFFFIYMERIILAEEAFLHKKFGAAYDDWRNKTPTILPNFKLWQAPDMVFSWKTVLKREYPGFLAIGTAFLIIEMAVDILFADHSIAEWLDEDLIWLIAYATILIIALTLRHLKKHTDILKVEGR